jgi:glycosyl hydrolase family 39 (putative alpha-L-iduronidase)
MLAQQAEPLSRVLPLNRFETSRSASATGQGFHRMATSIGDDYFDGTSPPSRLQRHFAVARQVGVKYLRCAFSWDAIEKKQGQYDWRFWDHLVDLAEQNGIRLLPYVAYTPEWAARAPENFWKQPPRDPQLYGDFMYTIAARYRGRILSWEIWNEPDNKDFWLGNADEFASLAELAARRIREANSAALLVLGGMAYGPGEFFQHLMSQYHIDRYVDVIAMHAYPESWMNERAETVFLKWVPAMQQLIETDHSGDALWVNEMGYADYRLRRNQASIYGTSVFYGYEHTRKYEAAMLFKFEIMALASGQVALTGWYRIDDFAPGKEKLGNDLVNYHLGLVDTAGHPKPDLFALRFFNQLFGLGARVIRQYDLPAAGSQSVIDVFLNAENKAVVVAWLRSSESNEVAQKSGTAPDARLEHVSIGLPCSGIKAVTYFNSQGQVEKAQARLVGNALTDVQLRGDRVFVAKVTCTAQAERSHLRTASGN